MYKVRLIVFVAVVSSMFIYWWRTDRSHVRAPLPSAAIAVVTSDPASIATATGSGGIATNGTASPSPGAAVSTGTGTSGAPAAAAGDAQGIYSRAPNTRADRPARAPAGRAPGDTTPRGPSDVDPRATRVAPTTSSREMRIGAAADGGMVGTARETSGGVLAGVRVQATQGGLLARTWTAATDSAGHYTLAGLPEGTYTVTFSAARHATVTRKVTVRPGQTVQGIDGVLARSD